MHKTDEWRKGRKNGPNNGNKSGSICGCKCPTHSGTLKREEVEEKGWETNGPG
jgi:hypothetical protein